MQVTPSIEFEKWSFGMCARRETIDSKSLATNLTIELPKYICVTNVSFQLNLMIILSFRVYFSEVRRLLSAMSYRTRCKRFSIGHQRSWKRIPLSLLELTQDSISSMKNPFHSRKHLKMNVTEPSVIVLSDSDSESEDSKVYPINKSNKTNAEIEVITLDDSTMNQSQASFVVDKTPDFIPVPKNIAYNKPKRGRKRRYFDEAPDVTVLKRPRRLTRQFLACTTTPPPSDVTTAIANPSTKKNIRPFTRKKCKNQTPKVIVKPKGLKKKVISKVKPSPKRNTSFRSRIPQIQLSHTNIHNTLETPRLAGGLRPIIIDGCNVAFGFGNGEFQSQGIILVIEYFKKRGHKEIISFLPNNYRFSHKPEDVFKQIKNYEKENIITYTPSRRLNGKLIKPYDDRFTVQYASEREGVIISNDGYLDLIDEESSWRTTIEQRIINFTFARGLLMLPKDPLGPKGPTLDEMLRFPST